MGSGRLSQQVNTIKKTSLAFAGPSSVEMGVDNRVAACNHWTTSKGSRVTGLYKMERRSIEQREPGRR
jgi:hypothetical protein